MQLYNRPQDKCGVLVVSSEMVDLSYTLYGIEIIQLLATHSWDKPDIKNSTSLDDLS